MVIMPEAQQTIDSDEVEEALPDSWWAENDGDQCVYAYSGDNVPGDPDMTASATIEVKSGEIWRASWLTPNPMRGGLHEPTDGRNGTKERCIEWIAEKAEVFGDGQEGDDEEGH